jgi:glycosyltransferase involved in cell wall biosynthesis
MAQLTVVIPTCNRPHLFKGALESVIGQAPRVDVVVVDDGSTPPLEASVADIPRSVRIVRRDSSAGPAAARNTGVQQATSEFIAFLDDDDIWVAGRANSILSTFSSYPTADVVVHTTRWNHEAKGSGHISLLSRPFRQFLISQPPHLDGVAVRRDRHLAEPFDESFRAVEDLDYLIRLAQSACFAFVDSLGAIHRASEEASAVSIETRIRSRLQFRNKHADLFDHRADAFHQMRLGHLYRRAGRRPDAVRAFGRAVRWNPMSAHAWRGLVLIMLPWAAQSRLVRRRR